MSLYRRIKIVPVLIGVETKVIWTLSIKKVWPKIKTFHVTDFSHLKYNTLQKFVNFSPKSWNIAFFEEVDWDYHETGEFFVSSKILMKYLKRVV